MIFPWKIIFNHHFWCSSAFPIIFPWFTRFSMVVSIGEKNTHHTSNHKNHGDFFGIAWKNIPKTFKKNTWILDPRKLRSLWSLYHGILPSLTIINHSPSPAFAFSPRLRFQDAAALDYASRRWPAPEDPCFFSSFIKGGSKKICEIWIDMGYFMLFPYDAEK